MRVLGRLLDYAGMWERDLYFVFLALCRKYEVAPSEVFNSEGRRNFRQGRLLSAFTRFKSAQSGDDRGQKVKDDLKRLFSLNAFHAGENGDAKVHTRNTLAHFNMLRPTEGAGRLDLTAIINDTRAKSLGRWKITSSVVPN